jgi:hypothetical protein
MIGVIVCSLHATRKLKGILPQYRTKYVEFEKIRNVKSVQIKLMYGCYRFHIRLLYFDR